MESAGAQDSNWDGKKDEGMNCGPEALLTGEDNQEDEFSMEEEEDEGVSTAGAEPDSAQGWC
jgi:hypothetical protein